MKNLKIYTDKSIRLIKRIWRNIVYAYKCMTYPCYEYTDLESASEEIPEKVKLLPFTTLQSFYQLPTYYPDAACSAKEGLEVTVKRALIHDARCFVYSDLIVLPNNKIINELKDVEYYRDKVDFTDEILLRDKDTLCQLNTKSITEVQKIPSAIKIGGMFGFNYYHFVYQLLTRLHYINDIDSTVPLLLDACARDIPTLKQLVELANVQKKRNSVYGLWMLL